MANTILLDTVTWDLLLDINGNIAMATEPYSLAQDAASAIKTFFGEVYFDTTIGVPYLTQIFGKSPTIAYLKAIFVAAAETVEDVSSAECFIASVSDRVVAGQVQVISASTGQTSAANFAVINPQGEG